jgi:hypothetical protein
MSLAPTCIVSTSVGQIPDLAGQNHYSWLNRIGSKPKLKQELLFDQPKVCRQLTAGLGPRHKNQIQIRPIFKTKPETRTLRQKKEKQNKTNTKKIPIYLSKGEARLLIKVKNCPTLL